MKILMLGWEFPPSITGGLGIASHGIAESLAKQGHDITFLLPKKTKNQQSKGIKLLDASTMKVEQDYWVKTTAISEIQDVELGAQVVAYMPPKIYRKLTSQSSLEKKKAFPEIADTPLTGKYDEGLLTETGKFALLAVQLASSKKYDLIYCHDWPTFKAGRLVKEMLGSRLAVHVHSTEYERNGVFTDPTVIREEGNGIRSADFIFTVSERTRSVIAEKYGVKKNKMTVTPNAGPLISFKPVVSKTKKKPIVAFIGRFTDQKSPGTFIDIARELTSRGLDYEFLMIGDGYLYHDLIEKSKELNLTERFKFPGFISHQKVLEMMGQIDLLIAPSNSEPFGLVMLEAILQHVAVLSTPDSGLSEFIPALPQSDRWDIYNSTSLSERLIEDKTYRKEIVDKCLKSASKLSWDKTAGMISEKIAQ